MKDVLPLFDISGISDGDTLLVRGHSYHVAKVISASDYKDSFIRQLASRQKVAKELIVFQPVGLRYKTLKSKSETPERVQVAEKYLVMKLYENGKLGPIEKKTLGNVTAWRALHGYKTAKQK